MKKTHSTPTVNATSLRRCEGRDLSDGQFIVKKEAPVVDPVQMQREEAEKLARLDEDLAEMKRISAALDARERAEEERRKNDPVYAARIQKDIDRTLLSNSGGYERPYVPSPIVAALLADAEE